MFKNFFDVSWMNYIDKQQFNIFLHEQNIEMKAAAAAVKKPSKKHQRDDENCRKALFRSTTDESQYETCESDECEDRTTNKRRLSIKERRQRTDLALAPIKKKRLVGRYSNSIVSSIFDGQLSSEIECLTCHRRSSTLETFQDLSLPIPSHEQVKVRMITLINHRLLYLFRWRNFLQFTLNKRLKTIRGFTGSLLYLKSLSQCFFSFVSVSSV